MTRGGSHKSIYALCQALMLCAKLLCPKKASQKFSTESKMAVCPTFSLYEISPRTWLVVHYDIKKYFK